jgi:prepilin-type N-terminal cleavage/methylation domain-containing protein
MKQNKQIGFSLIELLVVIGIIGILAVITTVSFGNSKIQARDTKRVADLDELFKSINLYYTTLEALPPDCSEPGYSGGCDTNDVPVPGAAIDTSNDNDFMSFLQPDFLNNSPRDPLSNGVNYYGYATNIEYPAGSGVIYDYMVFTILEDNNSEFVGVPPAAGQEDYYILGEQYQN